MRARQLIILLPSIVWNTSPQTPSPSDRQMDRFLRTFVGTWKATESFEVSGPKRQGKSREGTTHFHAAPGHALIEDYHSDGTAGKLDFLRNAMVERRRHKMCPGADRATRLALRLPNLLARLQRGAPSKPHVGRYTSPPFLCIAWE